MATIANLVDVTPTRTSPPTDTVTISLGSAWLVLETQEAGTVTLACPAITATQGMDSASLASAICTAQGVLSVTQEQGSACVRRSMLAELVDSARMGLVPSELAADNVVAMLLDLRENFVMRIAGNASAGPGSLG